MLRLASLSSRIMYQISESPEWPQNWQEKLCQEHKSGIQKSWHLRSFSQILYQKTSPQNAIYPQFSLICIMSLNSDAVHDKALYRNCFLPWLLMVRKNRIYISSFYPLFLFSIPIPKFLEFKPNLNTLKVRKLFLLLCSSLFFLQFYWEIINVHHCVSLRHMAWFD